METLDLGRVLQTAEAIKGMKRQGTMDKLQEQYMAQNAGYAKNADARAQAGEQRAQTTFDNQQVEHSQEQQIANTKLLNAASAELLQSPTQETVMRWLPQLQGAGVIPKDYAPTEFDPAKIQQMARQYYDSTSAALSALNPQKAPSNPTSYDEFALAQQDPEFKKFLESRKGKGISITNPDGSVIQIGGEGGAVNPQDLSGPTKNRLQESIIQSTDELERLNSIGQGFDPKFLQIPGRLKGVGLKVKDLAGGYLGDLTPEEGDYLTKFSTFKADAAKNLSTILNRLSGAAISPAEGERLKKGIPNDEDSPTQFVAKYRAAVKDSTRAIMRANWALKNGIGVKSVEDLSKAMPLSGIDAVYEQRANELWQSMGGTPEARQKAVQQANGEFGLNR